jgi:lipopolysaccharide export system protein LptA
MRKLLLIFIFFLPIHISAEKKDAPFKNFGVDSADNLPTEITSDSLTVNAKTRIFEYRKDVVVVHGDVTIRAEKVLGKYNDKNQITEITALGKVQVDKIDGTKARGEKAFYDAIKETVTLTENPSIEQNGSQLVADKIKVFLKENRSEASGSVRVKVVKKQATPPLPSPTASAAPSPILN